MALFSVLKIPKKEIWRNIGAEKLNLNQHSWPLF